MTPRVVFRAAAVDELREARDWFNAQRAGLGDELGEVVAATLERIAAHHTRFPKWSRAFGAP